MKKTYAKKEFCNYSNMSSIISTFHLDWKIIIAQIFNFAIVFVVLYIYAIKPLNKLMSERSDKISKGIGDAKNNEIILQATKIESEKIINQAKFEAQNILKKIKKEGEDKKIKMLQETKNEMGIILEQNKKNLEVEKIKMISEAKKEIVSLVIKTTEKLLDAKLGENYNQRAIQELEKIS